MEFGSLRRRDRVRLGVAVVASVVWMTAVRFDEPRVRVVAMVLLAIALLMRFVPGRVFGEPDTPDREDRS
jgi:hypothetical protein